MRDQRTQQRLSGWTKHHGDGSALRIPPRSGFERTQMRRQKHNALATALSLFEYGQIVADHPLRDRLGRTQPDVGQFACHPTGFDRRPDAGANSGQACSVKVLAKLAPIARRPDPCNHACDRAQCTGKPQRQAGHPRRQPDQPLALAGTRPWPRRWVHRPAVGGLGHGWRRGGFSGHQKNMGGIGEAANGARRNRFSTARACSAVYAKPL